MKARSAFLIAPALFAIACTMPNGENVDSSESAQNSTKCGNGVRDQGEQCDDGNTTSLDGCSKTCEFEQVHRLNSLEIMFNTDSFCTSNAIGSAVKGVAQGQFQDAIANAVADGSISVLLSFAKLGDLTGQNGAFKLASLIGDPAPGGGVDSWYTPNPIALDATGEPLVSLDATFTNGALSAGPGNVAFALSLGSAPVDVRMSGARVKAQVGASSTPAANAPGGSVGHLASENLDPAIKSFATTSGGQLCGNIGAGTLAAIPVPEQLTSGATSCSAGYTTANSMLDVFVGGCKVLFITALGATQPDKADPGVPAAGAGAPYTLQTGAGKKVTGCKDKSGAGVPLDACLKSAAYSAGVKFGSQRVIAR